MNKTLQTVSKYLLYKYSKTKCLHHFQCCLSLSTISSKQSFIHHIGKEPLVYRNVGQELDLSVAKYGSTEAIVSHHEGSRHTFKSLIDQVDRLAAGFLKIGLSPGDFIGIWGPNTMHWYLVMLAAARTGLVSVAINPAFQGPEVEYCLKKVNIKAIVAPEIHKTQNYYEIIRSICPELPMSEKGKIKSTNLPYLRSVIIDTKLQQKGAFTLDELLGLSDRKDEIGRMQNSISPDLPCNVQFTSGTTGKPKAAVLSHNNLVNNGRHVGARNMLEGQRICVQVPLFHVFGVVASIMAGMSYGATLVLPSAGFSPEASLQAVVKENCTVIHGTPTMQVDLISKQRELQLPLKTAKLVVSGGAPLSPQLAQDIIDVLGVERLHSIFGLTETTCVIFQSRSTNTLDQVLNTVGHVQDNTEVKVIDEHGNTVPFGQPGELCVRGYSSMLGYFGDEAKTKETIGDDRWVRTGDQFVLQEDGYGRIVGRLKEMIIRGGENIFPKEIEDFLNMHPRIAETYVVGVPDDRLGEEVCAFVRLKANDAQQNITRDEVKEFCKGKLSHFKVPRHVVTVQEFPKTTSGKIQKFMLRESFLKMNT